MSSVSDLSLTGPSEDEKAETSREGTRPMNWRDAELQE